MARSAPQLSRSDADPVLLLHLIRILALYLAACLSRSLATAVDDLVPLFVVGLQPQPAERIAVGQLDELLTAWVAREAESNQFDGLLPEHRAFLLIKRFFRQQEGAKQLRVLAALLASYLARLHEPLVSCGPADMVRSTLEYLLTTGKVLKAVSPALLYPLVNAVDSLSIEQRDCLEALTSLLQGLYDNSSEMALTKFMSCHHNKFILIEDLEGGDSKTGRGKLSTAIESVSEASTHLQALGVCFIKTLLCHSDHIFRRDPELAAPSTLLDSETEDEDFSEHSPNTSPASGARKEFPRHEDQESASSRLSESSHLSSAETDDADEDESRDSPVTAPAPIHKSRHATGKSATRSLRKRKKREHKAAVMPQIPPPIVREMPCSVAAGATFPVDMDESYATVAIAAAAGTLAAVLCVIFT